MTADPFDQSKPCKPGFVRIPDFLDVAVYDDALFLAYTKNDPAWQYILGKAGLPNTAEYREAHFNTEHFKILRWRSLGTLLFWRIRTALNLEWLRRLVSSLPAQREKSPEPVRARIYGPGSGSTSLDAGRASPPGPLALAGDSPAGQVMLRSIPR